MGLFNGVDPLAAAFANETLREGGVNIPAIQAPVGFNMFMNPVDMYKYEQWGPKY